MSITEGAVLRLANGETGFKPVVQVMDVNKIVSQQGGADRFRMVLSDGRHYQQGMLATSLNGLVSSKQITTGCFVRLGEYLCKPIKERRILIVLNLEVVAGSSPTVGAPANVDQALSGKTQVDSKTAGAPARAAPVKAARPAQTVESGVLSGEQIFPIANLNPYQSKWTVKARVTQKSYREYTNARGSGTLINVDLLDLEGGEIRATAFGETADEMDKVFEENKVFLVSRGEIKFANKRFNPLNHQYEVTMNRNTIVELCQDDAAIPHLQYNFVPIASIEDVPKDHTVDVVGVLTAVEEIGSITTRNGDNLNKRVITLADDSNASIHVTLWGSKAEEFGLPVGTVLAIKGLRVGDYGGRSLSAMKNAHFEPHADVPEAFRVKGWYDGNGAQGVRCLSTSYTGGGGSSGPLDSINLTEIRQRATSEATVRFMTKGTIVYIPSQNDPWYEACPGPDPKDPNRLCNKKIYTTGGNYVCDKCEGSFEKPNIRYICSFKVADFSGGQWMTGFNEVAEKLIGVDAETMKNWKDSSDPKFDEALKRPLFATHAFRCNASQDSMGDNGPRTKCTIQAATPLNFVAEARALLTDIARLEAL